MQCSVVLHHHNIFEGYTFQRLSKKNKPHDPEARAKFLQEPIPTFNSQTASKKVPKNLLIQQLKRTASTLYIPFCLFTYLVWVINLI